MDVNVGVKGVAQTQRQRGSFREVQLAQATHNTEGKERTSEQWQVRFSLCALPKSFLFSEGRGKAHVGLHTGDRTAE